jgi:hypothetical protein
MVSDILNGLLVVTLKDHEVVDFGLFWYETAVPVHTAAMVYSSRTSLT